MGRSGLGGSRKMSGQKIALGLQPTRPLEILQVQPDRLGYDVRHVEIVVLSHILQHFDELNWQPESRWLRMLQPPSRPRRQGGTNPYGLYCWLPYSSRMRLGLYSCWLYIDHSLRLQNRLVDHPRSCRGRQHLL